MMINSQHVPADTIPRAGANNGRNIYYRLCGVAGIAGALYLFIVLIAMHILRPEFNYITEFTSNYANGPYGSLFRSSLIIHGIGNGLMAVGLGYSLKGHRWGKIGAIFFGLSALGILFAGIFSTDATGSPQTVSGTIHVVAAIIAYVAEVVALFCLARAFLQNQYWQSFAPISGAIAKIGTVGFLTLIALLNFRFIPGLVERAASIPLYLWEFLAGYYLLHYRYQQPATCRDAARAPYFPRSVDKVRNIH